MQQVTKYLLDVKNHFLTFSKNHQKSTKNHQKSIKNDIARQNTRPRTGWMTDTWRTKSTEIIKNRTQNHQKSEKWHKWHQKSTFRNRRARQKDSQWQMLERIDTPKYRPWIYDTQNHQKWQKTTKWHQKSIIGLKNIRTTVSWEHPELKKWQMDSKMTIDQNNVSQEAVTESTI